MERRRDRKDGQDWYTTYPTMDETKRDRLEDIPTPQRVP